MTNQTVCAVVVTYNREELLLECLDALKNQTSKLDGIILIDNASRMDTPKKLLNKYIDKMPPKNYKQNWSTSKVIKNSEGENTITYIRMSENQGGAGGFYKGIKTAYEKGYDWIWLIDDDSNPNKTALENLKKHFNLKNVSALASLLKDEQNNILNIHRGFINFHNLSNHFIQAIKIENLELQNKWEIDHSSFDGILINSDAISKIGFPKKEFFIHGDDVEYCIRLKSVGKIFLISDSVIIHKEYPSNKIYKQLFGKKFQRDKYSNLWLAYYNKRNMTWLANKYNIKRVYFWIGLIKEWIKSLIGVILLDDDKKLRRMYFFSYAYLDGLKGNFDNKKPKKILYNKSYNELLGEYP